MNTALLFVWLVSGHSSAIPVEPETCIQAVEAVRRGDRVMIEDEAGTLFEVERARCVLDVNTEKQEPTS